MYDSTTIMMAEKDNLRLRIMVDDSPINPREDFDNLGTMICLHKRYNLGDKHSYRESDFSGWNNMYKKLKEEHDAVIILPLYLYDHSGITMNTTGFSCPWDSGQVGWILCSREDAEKEYGKITDKVLEEITKILCNEVKIYDMYLRGECYGFILDKKTVCEYCKHEEYKSIDSCWGFFGHKDMKSDIKATLSEEYTSLVDKLKEV